LLARTHASTRTLTRRALATATATAPFQTEGQVLKTLLALKNTRPLTIMLCTHSVTAAASTDRVIMLADGVVAETGPFNELVAKRGAFFELAKSHLGDAVKPPCTDTAAAASGADAAPAHPELEPAQEVPLPDSDASDSLLFAAMPDSLPSGSALSASGLESRVEPSSTGSLPVDETASVLDATIDVAASFGS
jgi:hypothetical protein